MRWKLQAHLQSSPFVPKAKYQAFTRGTRKLSLNLPYQSRLMAEPPINLTNIREGINGDWVIEEATHELSSQGLFTRITNIMKNLKILYKQYCNSLKNQPPKN